MIVCICQQVSDREITRQALRGLEFSDIQLELGVATQCGRCESCVREALQKANERSRNDEAIGQTRQIPWCTA